MSLATDLATIETILRTAQHDGADTGDIADALQAIEQVRQGCIALLEVVDGLLKVIDAAPAINCTEGDPIDDAFKVWEVATGEKHPPLECWDEESKREYERCN